MSNRKFFRCMKAGPVLPQIICIGARDNLFACAMADGRIEIGLAIEATVHWVGYITLVVELASIDDRQLPVLLRGERLYTLRRGDRHRWRYGMKYLTALR